MINVSLYDVESVFRIAKKTRSLPQRFGEKRYNDGVLWINGAYIKFSHKLVSINVFDPNLIPPYSVAILLNHLLQDEEIYIDGWKKPNKYYEKVDASTFLDPFLSDKEVEYEGN